MTTGGLTIRFIIQGMGLEGDQNINYAQNKTLAQSNETSVSIHLFEVFNNKEYTYFGEAILSAPPYQESQIDQKGNSRKVWMFPLKLKTNDTPVLSPSQLNSLKKIKEHKAKKLSTDELKKRALSVSKKPGTRKSETVQYERDEFISEYTKRIADGTCQLCHSKAPFLNKQNEPYLESHHIKWLSKGGEDTLENSIALCPNCHKKMHILNKESDIKFLQRANKTRYSESA